MPVFPRRESDVVALADSMIGGFINNPAVFPNSDVVGLQGVRATYQTKKLAQVDAEGKAKTATEFKDDALDALVDVMKVQLQQSEVDVAPDLSKLNLIGWGPRADSQPNPAPGQPRDLDPTVQGPGTLFLDWKSPAAGTGGRVRTYLIERREQATGGGFTDWHQAGIAFQSEITLPDQPRNTQLEYRVIAVNNGGNSVPSNTADVVL